jgi:hypothetical protein
MPRIYRAMKADGNRPMLGASASTLGIRPQVDIHPDNAGRVHPQTGGLSVSPSLSTIPLRFLPRRLHESGVQPGSFGSNSVSVWDMGEGAFETGAVSEQLNLRPDPANPTRHGFVEPATTMLLDEYADAVSATRDLWTVDES